MIRRTGGDRAAERMGRMAKIRNVRSCIYCKHLETCSVDEMLEGEKTGFACMEEHVLPQSRTARAILAVAGFDLVLLGAVLYKFVLWRWM